MKVVLASDNAHKLHEFRALLAGTSIELVSKRDVGCDITVEETGATFRENARLKAEAVFAATGLPALADDSGLCVDALDGAPGLYSARFTGSHDDSDASRYRYLLEKLADADNRGARFVCVICARMPDGAVLWGEGCCEGEILRAPAGEHGFGYDPVFRPAGFSTSMAQCTTEEKNAISHRGRAIRAFKAEWEKKYAQQ